MNNNLLAISLVFVSTWVGSIGSYFFKISSKKATTDWLKLLQNLPFLIGFFFFGCASLIYLYALQVSKLTILYPLSSLSYVWALLIGHFLLKEKITVLKVIGVSCILSGSFLVILSI